MKFLFAGFRHPHIYTLLNIAAKTENVTVSACYEADVSARREAEQKTGIAFADADYEQLLSGDIDAVAIGACAGKRAYGWVYVRFKVSSFGRGSQEDFAKRETRRGAKRFVYGAALSGL